MSLKELNFEMMNINELTENLLFNQKEVNRMRREIEKLEKLEITEIAKEISDNKSIETNSIKTTEKSKIEDEELEYYYEDLKGIKNSDTLYEDIKEILPSKKNLRYNDLIMKLKLIILKEIKEIERFIREEKITDIELLKEFSDEVKLSRNKINIISAISKEKEDEKDSTSNIENNLIFTTTSLGNVRALDEIKSIDESYYEKFQSLFMSIKDGTFKNVKRMYKVHNKVAGVSQVKEHKVRVVFDRISKHDYVIVAVFIKKSDKDRGYFTSLEDKVTKYKNQKDDIIKNLNNPEYRELNKQYEEELFNKLGKEKSKQKIKGADNNG